MLRVDPVINQNMRASVKALFDRDDSITYNRVAPGIGEVNNTVPGRPHHRRGEPGAQPDDGQRDDRRLPHNHWGFASGTGAENASNYTQWWQPNVVNPLTGQMGLDPAAARAVRRVRRPGAEDRSNKDEYPYLPELSFSGGDRANMLTDASVRRQRAAAALERELPLHVPGRPVVHAGRHNFKFGFYIERDSKTEPGSVGYAGQYNFGHSATNPISTGNGYANALLGLFTSYTELRQPRRRQEPALAGDAVRAGQLAHQLAA